MLSVIVIPSSKLNGLYLRKCIVFEQKTAKHLSASNSTTIASDSSLYETNHMISLPNILHDKIKIKAADLKETRHN